MIKRSESKSKCSPRKHRSAEARKRRLQMEGLERRELLAVLTEPPTQPALPLPEYPINRNIGAVQALQRVESERINEAGKNDLISNADILPLGTGPGQQATIDVSGRLPVGLSITNGSGFTADVDTFGFDLRAGDILDIATLGAAGGITVRDSLGSLHIISDELIGGVLEPRQSLGNANATVVIPSDGRYFVTISPQAADTSANYTLGLRVYRPSSESLAIGDTQIVYLDFAGAVIDNNIFNDALIQANPGLPAGGVTRVRSLLDSLPILGLQFGDIAAANRIIDIVQSEMERIFNDLATKGNNGDIEAPNAQPGDYGIRILNSRDHFGTVSFDDPRVTRLLIGGTGVDFGVDGVYGIAQSVDVGNFDLSEFGIFALDAITSDLAGIPISPAASQLDLVASFLGVVAAHEAGHTFGMIHTDNANSIGSLTDAGGTIQGLIYALGLGPDLTFRTADDVKPTFNNDYFMPGEVPDLNGFSFHRVTQSMAHALSSGTIGTSISGRAFRDANGDGNGSGDAGLSGVFVFADVNGNGVFDPSEPNALTGSSGSFNLAVGSKAVNVIAQTPTGFAPTTSVSQSGSSVNLAFGFRQVNPSGTGRVFSDADGNSFQDPSDPGLAGVFVYLDLNGNDRPDLGEPNATSGTNGNYTLNFPGPGPFTIRAVSPPGFEFTFPVGGEHLNGSPTGGNFDFGFRPSVDFGDAPASYGTTDSAGGAKHGITPGLTLGTLVDREIDGQPSANATADDLAGIDDEDGVRLLSPLAPGATATFRVDVTNTTPGTAYLQGFIDFNADGDFTDPGEQFARDLVVAAGVSTMFPTVAVPLTATVGNTFVRFRLSKDRGLGPNGFTASGEVEDYAFPILTSAKIANDDSVSVPRNTSTRINVLANDFETPENTLQVFRLRVDDLRDDAGRLVNTEGLVRISDDGRAVLYTPPSGFLGRDYFEYEAIDSNGNVSNPARVTVDVTFQTQVPIALDDVFEVPQGSSNRALNVLDNDLSSVFGGISITSVTAGSAGGTITIVGGGQSLRYTPRPGFAGTEQFNYSIQDAAGQSDTAQVTVNLLPGSLADDLIDFSIGIFDPVNTNREITNVRVGDEFLVRVFVDDLRTTLPQGVVSGFLDLLYTDEVATIVLNNSVPDITFGPLFSGGGSAQSGNVDTPGLIDEVGGVQRVDAQQPHTGRAELFTVRMRATSTGVAVFQSDPADALVSESVLLGQDVALTVSQQRLGNAELVVVPSSANFTAAVDDHYGPESKNPDGSFILVGNTFKLDVLANDNKGPTGVIREFEVVRNNDQLGDARRHDNGTPLNLNDDYIVYTPFTSNGLASFTYFIRTDDNVVSTADVTISLGNQGDRADVTYDLSLVSGDGSGNAIDPNNVRVGDRIGIQVNATDRRVNASAVFAGFMDVLYTSNVLRPGNAFQDDAFDFDVTFGDEKRRTPGNPSSGLPTYAEDPDIDATGLRPGIIDEVGTLSQLAQPTSQDLRNLNGSILFTLYFDVVGTGFTRVVSSPADSMPFSDTLLFNLDDPVAPVDIRYDELSFTVRSSLQNGRLAQDVNNDGFVTPIDALLVINQISRTTPEGEQAGGSGSSNGGYFTDVNGDNKVTALDALQVINYLVRSRDSESEGEQVFFAQSSGSASASGSVYDDVITDLSGESNIVDPGTSGSAASVNSSVAASGSTASDDDDDDWLGLLADDVSGQWS